MCVPLTPLRTATSALLLWSVSESRTLRPIFSCDCLDSRALCSLHCPNGLVRQLRRTGPPSGNPIRGAYRAHLYRIHSEISKERIEVATSGFFSAAFSSPASAQPAGFFCCCCPRVSLVPPFPRSLSSCVWPFLRCKKHLFARWKTRFGSFFHR